MSRLTGAYDLGRATGVCAATGIPLAQGASCVIALADAPTLESSNAGTPSGMFLRRLEYSSDAWNALIAAGTPPEGLYCFWRTTWAGGQQRKMLVDDETLLDIFHRLDSDERPQRMAFRFVLALLLVRKRLLRMVGHRRDKTKDGGDRELWLVIPRGSEPGTPPISVVNPRLGEDDVREIAAQLGEIMAGDITAGETMADPQ
ncbi:MAG: hypothetical protein SGJ11_16935 [Phycisphaerae bacterium]|nr:hypothetical protein [Phycisphaerae bacterium]